MAIDPSIAWHGTGPAGCTVINSMPRRARKVGLDLFLETRRHVPSQLAGFGIEGIDGLADIPYPRLHRTMAKNRRLFSPCRHTSQPAVVEALTLGMPVVALATTELPSCSPMVSTAPSRTTSTSSSPACIAPSTTRIAPGSAAPAPVIRASFASGSIGSRETGIEPSLRRSPWSERRTDRARRPVGRQAPAHPERRDRRHPARYGSPAMLHGPYEFSMQGG